MSLNRELSNSKIEGKSLLSTAQSSIDVFGVRISPASMKFRNTFGLSVNKQKLSIQNIGRSKVLVRIESPPSLTFRIKPVKGVCLSPGLRLVREVSFIPGIHVHNCIMRIYFDDNKFDYQLETITSVADISVEPRSIDFGTIDVNFTSQVQTVILTNNGDRATRFFIDFVKKDNQIVVDPIRGHLPPKSSRKINVSILGTVMGSINTDLWLIFEEPITIRITGIVIKPRFETLNVPSTSTFSIVDFPVTYSGVTCVETVFVRNDSESPAMFSFLGEVGNKMKPLKQCHKIDSNFKCFDVFPKDGIAESKEVRVLHFRFQPKFHKRKPLQLFYFAAFRMYRIRCKYLTADQYQTEASDDNTFASVLPIVSESFVLHGNESSFISTEMIDEAGYTQASQDRDYLKFYLHGMVEQPSVTIVPDELIIADLVIGARETRVLELKNNSQRLPIIVTYKKVAFIDVIQKSIFLKPFSSKQVTVTIGPYKIGTIITKVEFDLLFYDQPKTKDDYKVIGAIVVPVKLDVKSVTKLPPPQLNKGLTPNYIKEVGKFSQKVTFGDCSIEIPKATIAGLSLRKEECKTLIAFPNDTQKSLRPWRSNMQCKTIFTKYPRYIPPLEADELTAFDQQFKINADKYYTSYIRRKVEERNRSKVVKGIPDYDLTDTSKVMSEDLRCRKLPPMKFEDYGSKAFFIALTPSQMNSILINPTIIRTAPIALYSRYHFKIDIVNKNSSWIRIMARSDSNNIIFPFGCSKIIKGNSRLEHLATYLPGALGCHSINIDIIVNECIVFVVTVVADVCTPHLRLSKDLIEFTDYLPQGFIEIINPLNMDIPYSWLLPTSNFEFIPSEGIVKSQSSLTCQVKYLQDVAGPLSTDAEFYCGEKFQHQVKLVTETKDVKLYFVPDELIIEDAPLNIPVVRKVLLINDKAVMQSFRITVGDFSKYLKLYPMDGDISSKSQLLLTLTFTLPACVKFETTLHVEVYNSSPVSMVVKGNVVYPDVTISPTLLKFKTIPASSFDVFPLTIRNNSAAMVSIKFDLTQYPEFKVFETKKRWISTPINTLTIKANSLRNLFLYYIPLAASSDGFILPLIINGILGPVVDEDTTKHVSYFITEVIPYSCFTVTPQYLPYVWVKSYSTIPKLSFSKINIRLWYTLISRKSNTNYILRIRNNYKETEEFCIRTEDIIHPLHMKYLGGSDVTTYRKSFVGVLDPGEDVCFDISFKPDSPGVFKAQLPVYINSDKSKKPHNIIAIDAEFIPPTIECESSTIYLKPIPLQVKVFCSREFTLRAHSEECIVKCETNMQGITSEIIHEDAMNEVRKIVVRWKLQMKDVGIVSVPTTINCNCGAKCVVQLVIVVENCLLTNYAFTAAHISSAKYQGELRRNFSPDAMTLTSIGTVAAAEQALFKSRDYNLDEFLPEYPAFPSSTDELSKFMNDCLAVMERWIFTQGFYAISSYKIPVGINYANFTEVERPNLKKHWSESDGKVIIPYRELLYNLVGRELEEYLSPTLLSTSEYDKAIYTREVYKNALEIISNLGAYLPHVKPEYLLEYSFYCEYMQGQKEEVMDVDRYTQITKQCWLDVLFQTHKIAVLNQLSKPYGQQYVSKRKCKPHDEFHKSIKTLGKWNHIYSDTELLLLKWLEYHYWNVIEDYWYDNDFLQPIEISQFDRNMDDGFVYAAVTLAYCPYLESHYKKLCHQPLSYEELIHNNIVVLEAWEILSLSVNLTPQILAEQHPIVNFLLTCYLYDILPNIYPCETIEFVVGLSQMESKRIEIKNQNQFEVAYNVSLIGEDLGTFVTDSLNYVVPARSKRTVSISYIAKFVKEVRQTLILSGECYKYRFAKSKSITLIGKPAVSYLTQAIQLNIFPYVSKEVDLKIKSPYKTETKISYTVQFTSKECTSFDEINSLPFQNEIPELTLFTFFPLSANVEFNEDGDGVLKGLCNTFLQNDVSTRVYFKNAKVGCFGILIEISVKNVSELREIVNVIIPKSDSSSKLHRKLPFDVAYLELPCQNRLMWKTIIEALTKSYSEDKESLKRIVSTTPGMHILQKLLVIGSTPNDCSLCKPARYKVKSEKANVKLPKYIDIEDVCSPDFLRIPIKIKHKTRLPDEFTFSLFSLDGEEIRNYKTNFMFYNG